MKSLSSYITESIQDFKMSKEDFEKFQNIVKDFFKYSNVDLLSKGKLIFDDPDKFISDGKLATQFTYILDKPVTVKTSEDFTTLIRFDRRWDRNHDKGTAHITGIIGTLYYKDGSTQVNYKGKKEPEWALWIRPNGDVRRYRAKSTENINNREWRPLVIRKETLDALAEGNDVTVKDMSAENLFKELGSVVK